MSATRAGFLQDAGLSNYLLAQFCLSKPELRDEYRMYMVAAHQNYMSWGASAVAESLKERYPDAFNGPEYVERYSKRRSGFSGHRSSAKFSDLTKDLDDLSSAGGSSMFLNSLEDLDAIEANIQDLKFIE